MRGGERRNPNHFPSFWGKRDRLGWGEEAVFEKKKEGKCPPP